jgi:transposase
MGSKPSELTEAHWTKIALLLPEPKASRRGGPKSIPNHPVFEGILWILRTGARWQDLPERLPSPSTCWRRVRGWEERGIWRKTWRAF